MSDKKKIIIETNVMKKCWSPVGLVLVSRFGRKKTIT